MGNVVTFAVSVTCLQDMVVINVDPAALRDFDIGSGDFAIVNNYTETDPTTNLDSSCYAAYNAAGITLNVPLTSCNPQISQNLTHIRYAWYLRNSEQNIIQRTDACSQVVCEYPREIDVKSVYVNNTLMKTQLEKVADIGDFTLSLFTFSDEARTIPSNNFDVPNRIYARVQFTNHATVSDNYYIQIEDCSVDSEPVAPTFTFPIISSGLEDDTTCNVTVDAPPFQPNLEDFSFDSFIWTDPDTPNQLWICCTVYLCTEDVPGRNCSDDFVAPAGVRRRRSSGLDDFFEVKSEPITLY